MVKSEKEIKGRLKELEYRRDFLHSYYRKDNLQALYVWIKTLKWVLK